MFEKKNIDKEQFVEKKIKKKISKKLVNIIGSIFYGTILGIFLVAFFFKRITSNSVFYAACCSQLLIFLIYFNIDISYLWLNFIGAVFTVVLSIFLENIGLFRR